MTIRAGVVMDPIASIKPHKDTTLAMLLAAQARGWELSYMEQADLSLQGGTPRARLRPLQVRDTADDFFTLGPGAEEDLAELQLILMRKDPPFDMEYIHTTYVLEHAQQQGVLVVNDPRSLRDLNEKVACAWFPDCTPPTLVARDMDRLQRFVAQQGDAVVKPLSGMGGQSIFRVRASDPNLRVILETLTDEGRRFAMAQAFIPQIDQGDKRILLLDGEPVPYALARVPAPGEFRGNLARGATGRSVPLTERDRWICARVGPWLRQRGLVFVGLDVIGDFLTEINITSPTCIRELDRAEGLDIAGDLLGVLQRKLAC